MSQPHFKTEKQPSTELLANTKAAFLNFLAENEGQMPTYVELNRELKTSMSRLAPAARIVKNSVAVGGNTARKHARYPRRLAACPNSF